jgi:hypothetical protein
MKECPVNCCESLILRSALVCSECWARLPWWAREDLDRLHQTEPDSDLTRRTVEVAVAYLGETATREAAVG